MPNGLPRAYARQACWINRLLLSATYRVVICGQGLLSAKVAIPDTLLPQQTAADPQSSLPKSSD
jgi:hypothetical protein